MSVKKEIVQLQSPFFTHLGQNLSYGLFQDSFGNKRSRRTFETSRIFDKTQHWRGHVPWKERGPLHTFFPQSPISCSPVKTLVPTLRVLCQTLRREHFKPRKGRGNYLCSLTKVSVEKSFKPALRIELRIFSLRMRCVTTAPYGLLVYIEEK